MKNPILGHKPAYGRLAIPYPTDAGPVAMNFRCIQDHDCKSTDKHSKYWKPAGMPAELYGVQDYFHEGMTIHVAEGELDTLILKHVVGVPAMGIPGSSNWKPFWKLVFQDFDHVVIWSDGDPSGDSMARKLMKELGQVVKQIRLPEGEDVNSIYLKYGVEYLRSLI